MRYIERAAARVAYSTTGAGPAVLLVQGVGIVGEGWRPQIDGLAGHHQVIAFDNRGIGASTLGRGPLTIDALAADALAILDAEGIERCHVVGHSMGGLIAQAIALAQPARVASLTLMCTFPDGPSGARLTPSTLVASLRTRIGTRRMRRQAFLELVMPASLLRATDRDALAASLAPLFGRDLAEQPPIVMRQLRAMTRFDVRDRLGELAAVPTLVASAAEDRIAPPVRGRALTASIPGARYVEFSNAGHGLPIQYPHAVNLLLAEHFAGADALPNDPAGYWYAGARRCIVTARP
ncbi:alpha/beta hydrolase fold protein (plasmid) [Gemmatirosa kalamazoonensis]|uniref:Alpha/beta hydrolase fold protein n=1 Tax=Gemmatirosa kalamazoonensis TaxID=861299 RepID=W0RRB8_9BACT|nr:alpha/beta fold hydrolase [Gemmatirosa kalamazoonensis]AHG93012.1 alpha/beta hydrolase fold protein [Gemmatirosa kalamazoonensis]